MLLKRRLVCYINALDECAEDAVRDLLTYFEDLEEDVAFPRELLLCFSIRPYPNITIGHSEEIVLETNPGHTEDVREYALSRVLPHYLGISRPGTEESEQHLELVSEIIQRSSGVFLWVVLVVAQLRKSADHGEHPIRLREYLLVIPPTLNDLFDTIIEKDGANDCLLQIVQWILFAQGRLHGIDLYLAVNVNKCHPLNTWLILDRRDTKESWLPNFILTNSKGLLRMIDVKLGSYMPC